MEQEVSEERLNKYLKLTEKAIKKVKIKKQDIDSLKAAKDFLDMATRYYKDALYFKDQKDFVTAFAAINYAHGFLDAGARLKIFNVKDIKLFAAD